MTVTSKLLYFITEDWFFCSHFLERAMAARQAGYEVAVVTRIQKHSEQIEQAGIRTISLSMARSGMNPFQELGSLLKLLRIYWRERPELVHHIAVKPILYGTLCAKLTRVPVIVNAPVGMGYIFSSRQLKARLLRPLLLAAYRWLMNPPNGMTVFENPDDRRSLTEAGIVDFDRTSLIHGAGVDMNRFSPSPEPGGPVTIVFPARMLWDKGLAEFVEAARTLRETGCTARFALVGAPDRHNPTAATSAQLDSWVREGAIEWWGHRTDMPEVLRQAHIVCLPSYREGLPKSLIEAAACGRPIVTTDVPGCREVVRDGVNGLLVPAKSVAPLAEALRKLVDVPELRREMGFQGRQLALDAFSMERINTETLALYDALRHRLHNS